MAAPRLTEAELNEALRARPAWTREGDILRRRATLPGFPAAVEAVRRIADEAERMAHHPDIDIRYRTLAFALTTHDSGGLTRLDLALAAAIDAVLADLGAA